jgi:hypothetical protein
MPLSIALPSPLVIGIGVKSLSPEKGSLIGGLFASIPDSVISIFFLKGFPPFDEQDIYIQQFNSLPFPLPFPLPNLAILESGVFNFEEGV